MRTNTQTYKLFLYIWILVDFRQIDNSLAIFACNTKSTEKCLQYFHFLEFIRELMTFFSFSAFVHNFDKQSLENTTYQYEYDYNSIMHYGTHFFSSSRDKPTLVPIQKRAKIGQRDGISRLDCYKINVLYNCFDTPQNKAKYEAFCDILGI